MTKLFHPLLALIASATDSQLAKHVRYLKEENRVLRERLPAQIRTRPGERERLLKFGKPIGRAIEELITIVTPSTYQRWVREENKSKNTPSGRPRKNLALRELVLRLAKESGFGYTKILGELRRLGVYRICRQTVKNILKKEGIEPSPKRSTGTWDDYLKAHADTLWACDFFTKRSITTRGFVDLHVLVFMHIDSREVIATASTAHPNAAWVEQQAERFIEMTQSRAARPSHLIHDRDTKFTARFKEILKDAGVETKKLPVRSPNLNARVERFVQTIKQECLSRFIVFGRDHLDYLVSEFVGHYNNHRAHSSLAGHLPPKQTAPPDEWTSVNMEEIVCKERLGGVIKSFERRAA